MSIGSARAFSLINPSFEANSVTNLPSTSPGNSSFESAPPPRPNPGFVITAETNVNGWTTTDVGIELWQSGFNGVQSANVDNGNQFAEVNATQNKGIFQDITLGATANTPLYFNFWHRARENGNGQGAGSIQVNAITVTITDSVDGIFGNGNDNNVFSAVFATQLNPAALGSNNGWVNYSSLASGLNIPLNTGATAGDRLFRYGFIATQLTATTPNYYGTSAAGVTTPIAVTTTNTDISFGNFLDNANFGDDPTFSTPVPFDFEANVGIGILGALYFGRKAFKSWKNKKDNSN
ncbi:hypothetical protein H6F42_17905 [Pseudanabaena sp. FACHB-1998]|uniref:PFE-CTERM domain-containing protein n=1 Tax=Pseudanabaena sp. FACHB-1998 TaxID=2692858 RepID=UPI00168158EA|nr:hypothetical protein [Pseudanabaena sp. FACHB-1998]MBD2178797.1 hypothetical protein [Pseudanabaena sp. FACHB-1998]